MPDAAGCPQVALLAPFAARRDEWLRLDRRISALDAGLSARIAALAARLDALPASAGFEPFRAVPAAAAAGEGAGAGEPPAARARPRATLARRRAAGASTPGATAASPRQQPAAPTGALTSAALLPATLARALGAGLADLVVAGQTEALRRGLAGLPVAGKTRPSAAVHGAAPAVPAAAAPSDGLAHRLLAAAQLPTQAAGALVEELMQRALPGIADAGRPGDPAGLLGSLAQALAGAPPTATPMQAAAAKAVALAASAIAKPRGAAPAGLAGLAALPAALAVDAGRLLESILQPRTAPGQAAAPAARGQAPAAAAAGRAPARLLPAGAAAATPAAAAPRAPDAADGNPSALDELHRALLDQAWLRGVDLR